MLGSASGRSHAGLCPGYSLGKGPWGPKSPVTVVSTFLSPLREIRFTAILVAPYLMKQKYLVYLLSIFGLCRGKMSAAPQTHRTAARVSLATNVWTSQAALQATAQASARPIQMSAAARWMKISRTAVLGLRATCAWMTLSAPPAIAQISATGSKTSAASSWMKNSRTAALGLLATCVWQTPSAPPPMTAHPSAR